MSSALLIAAAYPVPTFTSDPVTPEGGDVWFNSTEGVYKTYDFESLVEEVLTLSVKVVTL